MSEIVIVEVKEHVGFVTLNRPEKYNALSIEMFQKIVEAGKTVMNDRSIRAINRSQGITWSISARKRSRRVTLPFRVQATDANVRWSPMPHPPITVYRFWVTCAGIP